MAVHGKRVKQIEKNRIGHEYSQRRDWIWNPFTSLKVLFLRKAGARVCCFRWLIGQSVDLLAPPLYGVKAAQLVSTVIHESSEQSETNMVIPCIRFVLRWQHFSTSGTQPFFLFQVALNAPHGSAENRYHPRFEPMEIWCSRKSPGATDLSL